MNRNWRHARQRSRLQRQERGEDEVNTKVLSLLDPDSFLKQT